MDGHLYEMDVCACVRERERESEIQLDGKDMFALVIQHLTSPG